MTAKKPSQADQCYTQLEEMIVTLQIDPGARISEKWVGETLGFGRTPVREAMLRLAHEGTLSIIPRAGAIVADIDIDGQLKLIQIRREIERLVAGLAASNATDEERETFRELAGKFREAARGNDPEIFIPTDLAFNQLVAEVANNPYAITMMAMIQSQTRRFWYLNFSHFGDLRGISVAHAVIADAIADGDYSRARLASDQLLDQVEAYSLRTIGKLVGTGDIAPAQHVSPPVA